MCKEVAIPDEKPAGMLTLEQLCRALAAHSMVVAHNNHLHSVMAPEIIEGTAQFIWRFALGEPVSRPSLMAETEDQV
jgi:hypothetical protein